MSEHSGSGTDRTGKTPDGKPVLKLRHFLPYRLNHLAETVSKSFSKIYADTYGIGIPEWRVLAILGECDAMTARDVCEATSMHKTKVSRAVAALEKRKFLQRDTNPLDQREQTLRLSSAGIAVYEDIVPRALAYSKELEDTLTSEQKSLLDDLFARLHKAASNHDGG